MENIVSDEEQDTSILQFRLSTPPFSFQDCEWHCQKRRGEDAFSVEKGTFMVTHNGIAIGVMSGSVIKELLRTASSFGTLEETMHIFISLIVIYSVYPISRPPCFVYHTLLFSFVFLDSIQIIGKVDLRNRPKNESFFGIL